MEVALQMARKLGARMWRTNMIIVGGGSGTMAEGDFRFYDMFLPLGSREGERERGIRRILLSQRSKVETAVMNEVRISTCHLRRPFVKRVEEESWAEET